MSKNVEIKKQKMDKRHVVNDNISSDEVMEVENGVSANSGWQIDKTLGEKHCFRIKRRNAQIRNQVFDEKYEESKQEREERKEKVVEIRRLLEEEKKVRDE